MEANKLVLIIFTIGLLSMACQAADKNKKFLRYFVAEEFEQSIFEKSEKANQDVVQDAKNVKNSSAGQVVRDSVGQEKVAITPEDAQYKLSYENYELTWRNFKKEHNKSYDSATEEKKRFAIFMDNVKMIERHNWQFHNRLSTYWMDINQFSDWTTEEFAAMMPAVDTSVIAKRRVRHYETYEPLKDFHEPSHCDWRSKGYVTGVKNQGQCGCGYAFSATGAIEGQWYAKNGSLVPLSEQQIVDCSMQYGNEGCNLGLADDAFHYLVHNAGGLQSEKTYPYEYIQGPCRFDMYRIVAEIQDYKTIPRDSEIALKSAVASIGPVSATIFASQNFQFYRGGVFVDETCNTGKTNQGVLVVGYGSSGSSDYWIVKNSWGPTWGEQGYIYMARNRDNMCYIATLASYPVV